MSRQEDRKISLSEAFLHAMEPPSEEEAYKASITQSLWSIDQFSALIAGLTPENYKNGTKGSTKISDNVFAKRESYATEVFSKFLDDMDKNGTSREFLIANNEMLMSSWKFIKWVAQNDISMNNRFFDSLPLYLIELYIEFQPFNTALRTAHHRSRAYHKALYLDHAKKLRQECPHMTPTDVYRHPRMENIERYIRQLGGKYKKRTFLESWLPEIMESTRGRPKKHKS